MLGRVVLELERQIGGGSKIMTKKWWHCISTTGGFMALERDAGGTGTKLQSSERRCLQQCKDSRGERHEIKPTHKPPSIWALLQSDNVPSAK